MDRLVLKLPFAIAALAITPAFVFAGPLPPLPNPLPGPNPPPSQPQPSPQPTDAQPAPAPPEQNKSSARPSIYAGPEDRALLGGAWGYRADPHDKGIERGWTAGWSAGRQVKVPYVPNAWPVTGKRGLRNFQGSVGWYVKRFRVAKTGRYAIRFESVHHRARVWIDGKLVASHIGAYLPFEARPLLAAGRQHTMVVRADWRSPLDMKRQGWHRGWFNFGGINREVTIRPVGATEVLNPNIQTKLRDDGAAVVDIRVTVRNNGPERDIAAQGTLRGGGPTIKFGFRKAHFSAGGARPLHRRFIVQHPRLWSPAKPQLYDMHLGAGPGSGWQAAVGLREISWAGGKLRVNGKPLVLYGASIHEDVKRRGDALTIGDANQIVRRLKRIGANSTRALHPLNPALLERLDYAGILVWQQVGPFDSPGNWMARTPQMRKSASDRVSESVAQTQTHPSILTWAVANEVAGNGHEGGQASWVAETSNHLKRTDPGRPVAIDIWGTHIPNQPGEMYKHVDLVGVTSYIGWYEFPFESRGSKQDRIRGRVARIRRVFPNQPLFVTEFGAEANSLNPTRRWGGFGYQADLISLHLHTYESLPQVDGMLIWNLQDFALTPNFAGGSIVKRVHSLKVVPGINQKGLFDYEGKAKPSARAAFQASASVRAANDSGR